MLSLSIWLSCFFPVYSLHLFYHEKKSRFSGISTDVGLLKVGGEGDYLNIFLAELKDEDVTTTMYAAQYPDKHNEKVF